MKDMMFGGYIARNHVGNNLTDRELRVLKDGDIDAMVSTFCKDASGGVYFTVKVCN